MAAAFLRHNTVRRKVRAQSLHHQLFARPVGFRDQIEIALQLERHAPLEIVRQERAGLARDLYRCFQVRHALRFFPLFGEVLDVVFENEKVGIPFSRDADETLVVILDDADHFFSIFQFHPDRRRMLDQLFEIFGLFKRLFRRARGFSCGRWRSSFS